MLQTHLDSAYSYFRCRLQRRFAVGSFSFFVIFLFVFHFRLLPFVLFACTAYSVVSVYCLPNAWLPSLVFVCLLHASNLNGWIIFLFVSFCFSSCATHFLYIYRCCNSTMLGVYSYAAAAARCQGFAPSVDLFIYIFSIPLFISLFLFKRCMKTNTASNANEVNG